MIIHSSNPNAVTKWHQLSGIVNDQTEFPKVNWDNSSAAKRMSGLLGVQQLRQLHKSNTIIDIGFIAITVLLLAFVTYGLVATDKIWMWIPLALIQQFLISSWFYTIRHDIFMHRQLGGSKVAYICGILLSLPMMNSYTRFLRHEDHHEHVGYDLFEEHLAELDTIWKRWLCLSMPGLLLLIAKKLRSENAPKPNSSWITPEVVKEGRKVEAIFQAVWLLGLGALLVLFPVELLKGYAVPFILFTPIVVSIKNALQHSETDTNNAFHSSAFFKVPFIWRVLYCDTIGTAHIVHHIFPRISWWKINRAVKLIHPHLKDFGVPERSMNEVLIGYYIKGKPYREHWGSTEKIG